MIMHDYCNFQLLTNRKIMTIRLLLTRFYATVGMVVKGSCTLCDKVLCQSGSDVSHPGHFCLVTPRACARGNIGQQNSHMHAAAALTVTVASQIDVDAVRRICALLLHKCMHPLTCIILMFMYLATQLAIQPYAEESVPMYLAVPLLNYLQALGLLE